MKYDISTPSSHHIPTVADKLSSWITKFKNTRDVFIFSPTLNLYLVKPETQWEHYPPTFFANFIRWIGPGNCSLFSVESQKSPLNKAGGDFKRTMPTIKSNRRMIIFIWLLFSLLLCDLLFSNIVYSTVVYCIARFVNWWRVTVSFLFALYIYMRTVPFCAVSLCFRLSRQLLIHIYQY